MRSTITRATRRLALAPRALSTHTSDVVVVGTGVAGCAAALRAAHAGLSVTLLTNQRDPTSCNSYWAQGGIIYKAHDDQPELLAADIHKAGAGLCDHDAVDFLARAGPSVVDELLLDAEGVIPAANVPFDRDANDQLSLCLEASHNRARIIHWKDHTGKAISEHIVAAAKAHPRVSLHTDISVIDLVTRESPRRCVGVTALDVSDAAAPAPCTFTAPSVVLATGGLGALYEHTSNPSQAIGEGVGIALRAGVATSMLEYVQFHPTTLYVPGESRFLLTEALRGEGARLLNQRGHAFARDYDSDGELAPRDIVARMIIAEMRLHEEDNMWLDISHRDSDWLRGRFPSIDEECRRRGFDITREPVPVVPASHYSCGGITTDLHARTSLPGLLAAGEVACTGLHGANRLASTSLLEGLVWGCAAADSAVERAATASAEAVDDVPASAPANVDAAQADAVLKRIQSVMWRGVGVVRTFEGMTHACAELHQLRAIADDLAANSPWDNRLTTLRNAAATAETIAQAALRNPQSAGAHYVEDAEADAQHAANAL